MQFRRLVVLLPSSAWEEFPTHHTGETAESLLAAWTAPWHPALLAHVEGIPSPLSTDAAPNAFDAALVIAPAEEVTPTSSQLIEAIQSAGGVLITAHQPREAVVASALRAAQLAATTDADLAEDFFALGYWRLQIELLTRHMSYGSNLDEARFRQHVVQAAQAAVAGDAATAREHLGRGFSVLAEERDHYYPVDSYLLDLTLQAETVAASALDVELDDPTHISFWLTGHVLGELHHNHGEVVERLRLRQREGTVTVIGGEQGQPAWPLQSAEAMLRGLRTGMATMEQVTGITPRRFFRRRFGMTPIVPALLTQLGFTGVVHATLDEGKFPSSAQARAKWQAPDGTALDAMTCIPLDASRPDTFLRLALRMGESMERDHVATLCLAHWAGGVSPWYKALRRGARYGLALGKFVTLEEYFQQTAFTTHEDNFSADRYRSPYLRQAVSHDEADPISRWVRYWQADSRLNAALHLETWAALLDEASEDDGSSIAKEGGNVGQPGEEAESDLAVTCRLVAAELSGHAAEDVRTADEYLDRAARRLALAVCRAEDAGDRSWLVINPHSAVNRCNLDLGHGDHAMPAESPIHAATVNAEQSLEVVADVPPAGFAWIPPAAQPVKSRQRRLPPIVADERRLENDFLSAHIDEKTGGLRALYDHRSRGNRLSQRLAFGPALDGARMRCNKICVTHNSMVRGEITSSGDLLDSQDELVADFCQSFELWRGNRVLQMRLRIEPRRQLGTDPWRDYIACRFAHPSETDQLFRAVNGLRLPTRLKRTEAPLYVEIDEGPRHTTIFTAGLPYHLRVGSRMFDSLLLVAGETCREFAIGIGVDVANSHTTALQQLVPHVVLSGQLQPASPTGWLFHLSAPQVIATAWQPLLSSRRGPSDAPRGFRVRLMESSGKPLKLRVKSLRPILAAWKCDFCGRQTASCEVRDGAAVFPMAAHEWTELAAEW